MNNTNDDFDIKEQIDRYVNGQLSEEEIENLWPKLIQHKEYIDYLKNSANLKEIARKQEKPQTKIYQKPWAYAAAAAILLLMVVVGALRFGMFKPSMDVEPVEQIELDYYRSTETITDASDKDQVIRKALNLVNKGQFEEGINLLNSARSKARDVTWIAKLDITLGTLYYNADKFNEAAYYFKDVLDYKDDINVLTLEKAYWYLGNSYFQMNMLEEAEQAMQKTYELNGAYSRVAKSYLDAMKDALATNAEE